MTLVGQILFKVGKELSGALGSLLTLSLMNMMTLSNGTCLGLSFLICKTWDVQ